MSESIRNLARSLWGEGNYDAVSVLSEKTGQDVINPWADASGRVEFDTDEEAIAYWGLELFTEFCDKARAYLKEE